MSVAITGQEGSVALYDSVTNVAFGPIFEDSDKADEFLEWFREGYEADRTFPFNRDELRFLDDVRRYRPTELQELHKLWWSETQLTELDNDEFLEA